MAPAEKVSLLIGSRHRTVNPLYGDLVLSGVSICASPNFAILGVKFDSKFTFEDHVRGLSENLYFEVGEAYICALPIE